MENEQLIQAVLHFTESVKSAQWRKNYDYGEGLYHNLQEYDSVLDFRKKRRKKRKKEIEKLKKMHFK